MHFFVERVVEVCKILIHKEANNSNKDKKQNNFQQDRVNLYIRIGKAGYHSQSNDAENIINDSST